MTDNTSNNLKYAAAAQFAFCCAFLFLFSCSKQPRYPVPAQAGNDIVVETAALQPDEPLYFSFPYQGKHINFFILKTGDTVQSYLDACINCYKHKLGYQYEEGFVVCRACNTNYSVFKLEKGLGGCYPIKIDGRIERGQYRIPVPTLESAVDKF